MEEIKKTRKYVLCLDFVVVRADNAVSSDLSCINITMVTKPSLAMRGTRLGPY